jgi:HAD superfamily hydrolase (TIGR01549 family)
MGGDTKLLRDQVKVALFDLGGTLLYDNVEAWETVYPRAEAALRGALEKAGIQAAPQDLYEGRPSLLEYYYALRTGVEEPGIERVLGRLLDAAGERLGQAQVRGALDAMFEVTQGNWQLEEDAFEALGTIREAQIRLGAISNGSDDKNARQMLEKTSLLPLFEFILTSAAFGRRKPDPAIFRAALAHFGASPREAIMVGDDYEADILGAASIGMKAIWITRRARHHRGEEAGEAVAAVGTLREVANLLT